MKIVKIVTKTTDWVHINRRNHLDVYLQCNLLECCIVLYKIQFYNSKIDSISNNVTAIKLVTECILILVFNVTRSQLIVLQFKDFWRKI